MRLDFEWLALCGSKFKGVAIRRILWSGLLRRSRVPGADLGVGVWPVLSGAAANCSPQRSWAGPGVTWFSSWLWRRELRCCCCWKSCASQDRSSQPTDWCREAAGTQDIEFNLPAEEGKSGIMRWRNKISIWVWERYFPDPSGHHQIIWAGTALHVFLMADRLNPTGGALITQVSPVVLLLILI